MDRDPESRLLNEVGGLGRWPFVLAMELEPGLVVVLYRDVMVAILSAELDWPTSLVPLWL